jgi:cullin-4
MFKDIDLSSDVMRAYSTKSNDANNVDLYVNVLSMGNWPSYPPVNVRIPESMVKNLERFKAFYTSKHSGRTLQWQHSLDHCTLKAAFPKGGKKELAVSLFQALILLLFNEVPKGGVLSFNEIVEATRIGQSYFLLFLLVSLFIRADADARSEGGL